MEKRAALLVALLSLPCCTETAQQVTETVAVVNGEPIAVRELSLALEAEARVASRALDDPEWLDERKRQILDELIERRLILQAGRSHGIVVPEEEVDKAFLRLRAEYPGQTFEELLSSERLTSADLRDRLRRQLLLERLFAKEVYARVAVTDQEIDAWLKENPDALPDTPEKVRASQIVVKTEEEAKAIHEELRKGASFAEVAMKRSLSPDAKVGGDLGWFARGEMPPPFDDVCFRLPPGKISDVVESAYGFHIFLVQEKQRSVRLGDEERAKEAEAMVRREKSLAAQDEFLASLRKNAVVEVNEKILSRLGTR